MKLNLIKNKGQKSSIYFLVLITVNIFLSSETFARVLDLNQEKFSSYLFFNEAQANLKDSPWINESTATASDNSYSTSLGGVMGGEFGFTYKVQTVAWRFGFEIIKPQKLKSINASLSGTTLYQIDSDVTGYAPKIGLEISPWRTPRQRVFIFGYYGSATIMLKNEYTNVTISPTADHTVEMSGSGTLAGGGLGYEIGMLDTTSFVLEAAYRSLKISEFKYTKNVTTFSGAVTSGATAYLIDGTTKRSVDLSGFYVTVGFRFWL